MKRIADVRVAFRQWGTYRVPYTDTSYACHIIADEGEESAAELEGAANAAQGVTWNLERRERGWEGSIAGPDPVEVESVRRRLLEGMGWEPLDEEPEQQ